MAISIVELFPFLSCYWPYILSLVLLVYCIYFTTKPDKRKKAVTLESTKQSKSVILVNKHKKSEEEDNNQHEEVLPSLFPPDLAHIPLPAFEYLPEEEMVNRSTTFYKTMKKRRSIRSYRPDSTIPYEVIRNAILTAGTGPSGIHTQPWTFVIVRENEMKAKIREIVEIEERFNYEQRMGAQWVADLRCLRTDWRKEYLTTVPVLILVFKKTHTYSPSGRVITYYSEISVGAAIGILVSALQNAGLASIVTTPLNCGPNLRTLLGRPSFEKLRTLIAVGYPADNVLVPDFNRKPFEEIAVEF